MVGGMHIVGPSHVLYAGQAGTDAGLGGWATRTSRR